MPSQDKLKSYREKRDFRRTPEPSGERKSSSDELIFVIHKHDATQRDYDYRLEVEGVLKSWAVPNGISTDPRERRMAVPTEDHPLEYADFEGVIPKDEYGGGTVMVWDTGTYRNLRAEKEGKQMSMKEALADGKAEVWLEGHKIQGGYALIRSNFRGKENWLLVKMDDEKADARRNPVSTEPDSVLSGRSLEQIAEEEGESKEK